MKMTGMNMSFPQPLHSGQISVLQQGVGNLGDRVDVLDAAITTDAYSASSTYAVNDYCIYENVMYKCITAIETPEAFTPSHWQATSIEGEISELNSSLSGLFKVVTFPNSQTLTVPANGAANVTANQMNISTPAGYTPVALSAFFCNSNDVVWRSVQAQATGNSSFTVLRNVTSTSKDVILNCSLLYVKTNFYHN